MNSQTHSLMLALYKATNIQPRFYLGNFNHHMRTYTHKLNDKEIDKHVTKLDVLLTSIYCWHNHNIDTTPMGYSLF